MRRINTFIIEDLLANPGRTWFASMTNGYVSHDNCIDIEDVETTLLAGSEAFGEIVVPVLMGGNFGGAGSLLLSLIGGFTSARSPSLGCTTGVAGGSESLISPSSLAWASSSSLGSVLTVTDTDGAVVSDEAVEDAPAGSS